ncbi:hypothetical protein [Cupriavidus campinensis]
MDTLESIFNEFSARLSALGMTTVGCRKRGTSEAAIFIGRTSKDAVGAYYDYEKGVRLPDENREICGEREAFVDVRSDEWPPTEPYTDRAANLVRSKVHVSTRKTYKVKRFPGDALPHRDGPYITYRDGQAKYQFFTQGRWEGDSPEQWSGIDWRVTRQEMRRLIAELVDEAQLDAGLALLRHCYASRAPELSESVGDDDIWGVRALVVRRAMYARIAWRNAIDADIAYLGELMPTEEVLKELDQRMQAFWANQEL